MASILGDRERVEMSGRRRRISTSGTNKSSEKRLTKDSETRDRYSFIMSLESSVSGNMPSRFLGELVAAFDLEVGDHTLFCVLGDAPAGQKPLVEMVLVVALENILVFQEPEEDYGLLKNALKKDGESLRWA
jgi:hypothetical protein